jgi:hypothetical protein
VLANVHSLRDAIDAAMQLDPNLTTTQEGAP